MSKKWITALSVLALLSGGVYAKDWSKIRVAIEGDYPPFNYLSPDKKIMGFDKDIADAVCLELKAKCTFVLQAWDGMIPALIAKRFDIIVSSMATTEERKKKVSFSRPYYSTPSQFISKKTNKFNVDSPAALKGKRLASQTGTIQEKYLKQQYEPAGAKVISYPTMEQAFLDLAAGRIDAVVGDAVANSAFLKGKAGAAFEPKGKLMQEGEIWGTGAGIVLRKEDQDLRAKIDQALINLHKSGKYDVIRKKYFNFDIWVK